MSGGQGLLFFDKPGEYLSGTACRAIGRKKNRFEIIEVAACHPIPDHGNHRFVLVSERIVGNLIHQLRLSFVANQTIASVHPEIMGAVFALRSEEHTSELQSLMRISYAVFCLKKKTTNNHNKPYSHTKQLKHTQI